MKAALYIRVSTEEQAEEGFSIAAQLRQLTDYCIKNNIEIYKVYSDEGISGQKENRPQFQAMIKDAEKKLFNIILVHKYDRFARKVELSQKIKNQLKKTGINVISITEPIEDSPMGFFVSGLHDLLAEYYVRNLSAESKKGHIERAAQGLHNGSVPYGYKLENDKMVINPEQAEIVKLIFDLYVNKGYGSTKIALFLNNNNIPSAVSGQWAHYTVSRILKNVKYIGKIYYAGNVYDGIHQPIIDNETFELAQKYMKERTWKREYRGSNFPKFLFLGLLRCGECGKVFRVHPNTKSNSKRKNSLYYYICNNASHADAKNRCSFRKYFSTVLLEKHIMDMINSIAAGAEIEYTVKESSSSIDIIANRKEKLIRQIERAKQAYLAGEFTLQEYSEIKAKANKELAEISEYKAPEVNRKKVQHKIKTALDRLESCKDIPEKKAVLKMIIESIYVSRDSIDIHFVL